MRILLLIVFLLGGCANVARDFPPPDADTYRDAQIPGYENVRFFADEVPVVLDGFLANAREALVRNPGLAARRDGLALSGGAEDGAYGAGFLKGWTERGDRPEFSWVTGVSTGALIAPFAFLGPEYDDALERLYTETSTKDIIDLTPFRALFGGASIGETAPLRALIESQIDADFVAAIAREYRRGRILLVGTTNLDAQQHVVWNIGAIAGSGRPDAAGLIADVLLASASIPGAFPPVKFDVVIDGARFQEVHVDGGITHQIFAYPIRTPVREIEERLGIFPKKTMWVIRNSKIAPEYRPADLRAGSIAARSVFTLTKYQGRGDLRSLEQLAQRDRYEFRLTFVPESFDRPYERFFDPDYMRALFNVGYETALGDAPWVESLNAVIAPEDRNAVRNRSGRRLPPSASRQRPRVPRG